MKTLYVWSLCFFFSSCIHDTMEKDSSLDTVTKKLQYGSIVTFTVKKFKVSESCEFDETPWIYQGRLWGISVLTNPPRNILLAGKLNLNGQEIELNTDGMANPWVNVNEFDSRYARLTREKVIKSNGSPDFYYRLEVAFLKGGAEDYIATWEIYKNKSFRVKIEGIVDTTPVWW